MTRRARPQKGKAMPADLSMPVMQRRRTLGPAIGSPCDLAGRKAQQRIKIQEIRAALIRSGFLTLDEQTRILGLPRSTAWSILRPNHKSSGLSAGTINRILVSPRLPTPVRQKIFEYVREKIAGLYGHSERRRREFAACLTVAQIDDVLTESFGRDHRRRPRQLRANRTSRPPRPEISITAAEE